MTFDLHIGIDYSGAETASSRLRGLQVFVASEGAPERVTTPAAQEGQHWNWSRSEIAQWLIEHVSGEARIIAGIDHGFSFPLSYFQRYGLTSWRSFLDDFVKHWPTHQPYLYVELIREEGPERVGSANEFRITEKRTSSAKSVFRFGGQGQVAKSTHAGIPWLWHIRNEVRDRVHFWPFDGWEIPEDKSAIVEVYSSVFRNRYPKEGRTSDEHDAYCVARWLSETCQSGLLGQDPEPPLTRVERETAALEGWILGIM